MLVRKTRKKQKNGSIKCGPWTPCARGAQVCECELSRALELFLAPLEYVTCNEAMPSMQNIGQISWTGEAIPKEALAAGLI